MATRNFRPDSVLGEGGLGSVLNGWIDEHTFAASKLGTGMIIAGKRLNQESFQGHREWLAEVNYLGQFCHPHLGKLIGYCLEDEHRLLVYEYMPRGSSKNHLFRRGSSFQPLSWSLRLKVVLGAAKGLAFPHGAETRVIYRDFNTSNILLDSHALKLLYAAMGVGVSAFVEGLCCARTAERQTSRMRMEYLKSVLRQDVGFFDTQTAGTSTTCQVVTLISSDATSIQVALCEKIPNCLASSGSRGPSSGSRGPSSGSRGPSSGSRGPSSGSRGPSSGSRGPSSGSRGPSSGLSTFASTMDGRD